MTDNEALFNCPEMRNPAYVEAPYEVAFAFMVPRLNHIHPRRRRLKARRRYVKNFLKNIGPPTHYVGTDLACPAASRIIVPRFVYRLEDFH